MTRVLVISDFHCGHVVGLTPPDWDKRPGDGYGTHAYAFYKHRRNCYKWYADWCAKLLPDIVIVNGDAVEGKGERSGSTELITTDRTEQVDMAVACIQETKAPRIVMSYGTSSHTGVLEDWENRVAKDVGAEKIGSADDIKIHGKIINYRHHCGRSSIPHGRGTPLAKERLWNVLWAERGEYPKADIVIRSHVHYFAFIGEGDWLAVSTPALQGYGSKYGVRRMSGTVDFGLCWFDIDENGGVAWDWKLKRFRKKHEFALTV